MTTTNEEATLNTATTTLILGASGMTGRRLVEQLLAEKQNVKAIVRSKERFKEIIPDNEKLLVIESTGKVSFVNQLVHNVVSRFS